MPLVSPFDRDLVFHKLFSKLGRWCLLSYACLTRLFPLHRTTADPGYRFLIAEELPVPGRRSLANKVLIMQLSIGDRHSGLKWYKIDAFIP